MKFYRVRYSSEGGNSGGYSWHTSRRDAEKAARDAAANDPAEYIDGPPQWDEIEIVPTKKSLLDALNTYAGHPNNG
jgi:hypothetical protein